MPVRFVLILLLGCGGGGATDAAVDDAALDGASIDANIDTGALDASEDSTLADVPVPDASVDVPSVLGQRHVVSFAQPQLTAIVTGAPYPTPRHTPAFYEQTYRDLGVTVSSWNDIRWTAEWPREIADHVARSHAEGIAVVGTLSTIDLYPRVDDEPVELLEAALIDPFGNRFEEVFGETRLALHSFLHPRWEAFLLAESQRLVEAGVDALVIDELPYASLFLPDFNDNTVAGFRDYLVSLPADEQEALRVRWGVDDLGVIDYPAMVRDALPPGTTELTREDWGDFALVSTLPLYREYERYRHIAHREVATSLLSDLRAWMNTTLGRQLPIGMNPNGLSAPEGVGLANLVDFVDIEYFYVRDGHFPAARTTPSVRLAEALSTPGLVMSAAAESRPWLASRGAENTRGFYRLMIADAYASGASTCVEEGAGGIEQDIDLLAPFYRFPREHPELFDDLERPATGLAVLWLWEAQDVYNSRPYRGLSHALTDRGFSFDVLFGAHPHRFWGERIPYPAPDAPLSLERLSATSFAVIPELTDLTELHAGILRAWVQAGGTLLAFADDGMLDAVAAQRGTNPDVSAIIDAFRADDSAMGSGRVIRIAEALPRQYLADPTSTSRNQVTGALEDAGFVPFVELDTEGVVSAFPYIDGTSEIVVHLVNYDYDPTTDVIAPSATATLTIDATALASELQATLLRPGSVEESLVVSGDGRITVQLSDVGVWSVVRITSR